MALVIGAEDQLHPLLNNTLKRLVYHTGYPVGLFLLGSSIPDVATERRYQLVSSIGDYRLKPYLEKVLKLPPQLSGEAPGQFEIDADSMKNMPLRQNYYCCGLRLPVPGEGMILLLSPVDSNPDIPFTTIFQPIMANLATAIQLCRSHETFTRTLIDDRDRALLDNERFRSATDTSTDCIFLIDPQSMRFIDFNKTAGEVLGYSRDRLTQLGPQHIEPKRTREELQSYFFSLLEHPEGIGKLDTEHQHSDGSVIPVEIRYSVLSQRDQQPLIISVVRDIRERKVAEARLYEEKERAQVTLKSIGDAVITTDTEGRIEFMNPIAERLTEWSHDMAKGEKLTRVFHIINESTREPVANPVERCLRENRIIGLANHTVLISRTGEEIAIEDSAAPIRDASGAITGVVLVFHDVSRARELANELSWNASHDPLTELVNRREFEHRLELAFQQAIEGRATHTLLYLDLDQFKLVNDTCGHIAGDQLLREVSITLKRIVRDSDTLARLGGDEFGLLLQNCDALLAQRLAKQIHEAVKSFTFIWKGKSFKVGASIGIVEINSEVESSTQLMSDADVACYAAKDKGGNRMHRYQPDDNELAQRKGEMRWVSRINHALENDRFILLAQPIVPVQDDHRISHYELLLRMIDEDGSLISPDSFIPAAERYKLMYKIDRLVIHKALQFYSEHRSQIDGTVLTINLSGFSLTQETLSDFIRQKFQQNDIQPGHFCFEITETAAISNLSQAQRVMKDLKEIGASFALDDFGSGLSSFNYLKNLHVDYLKIDGSFIRDMFEDAFDASLVDAINKIGHEIGLKTIAEFVENDSIMQQLREIGVDYAQGYAIGLPMPLEEIYSSISSSERAIMTASSRPNSEG